MKVLDQETSNKFSESERKEGGVGEKVRVNENLLVFDRISDPIALSYHLYEISLSHRRFYLLLVEKGEEAAAEIIGREEKSARAFYAKIVSGRVTPDFLHDLVAEYGEGSEPIA